METIFGTLYLKFQDSLCGVNSSGAAVPDTNLSIANRYGVQFSPRQSMFANRLLALKNYFGRVNSVLVQFPIAEIRSFPLLYSSFKLFLSKNYTKPVVLLHLIEGTPAFNTMKKLKDGQ